MPTGLRRNNKYLSFKSVEAHTTASAQKVAVSLLASFEKNVFMKWDREKLNIFDKEFVTLH